MQICELLARFDLYYKVSQLLSRYPATLMISGLLSRFLVRFLIDPQTVPKAAYNNDVQF